VKLFFGHCVLFGMKKDNDIILPAPGSREGSQEQMSFFSNEDGIPLNQFVALESDMSFVSDCENTPKIHPNLDQNDPVSYAYRKHTKSEYETRDLSILHGDPSESRLSRMSMLKFNSSPMSQEDLEPPSQMLTSVDVTINNRVQKGLWAEVFRHVLTIFPNTLVPFKRILLNSCEEITFLEETGLIKLVTPDGDVLVDALSKIETEELYHKMKSAIKIQLNTLGQRFAPLDEFKTEKGLISHGDINFVAQTGDILVCRAKCLAGTITRIATGSHWDHVGMFVWVGIKGKRTLCIFEALGNTGTQLFAWDKYKSEDWFRDYSVMALRRIFVPPYIARKMEDDIARFAIENCDRKYKINVGQIIMRQPSMDYRDPSRTYFCSSLVAKCYKESGILPPQIQSHQYMPKHFAEIDGCIGFMKGCELENEVHSVDFGASEDDSGTGCACTIL